MVTWWLMGQEERRDSLTGINLARSDGSVQSRKNSMAKRDSVAMAKSDGTLNSQTNGLNQKETNAVSGEGTFVPRRQSYSKIVSFNGHSQNSSSSPEQLDQNLPLPGSVITDNEPLL